MNIETYEPEETETVSTAIEADDDATQYELASETFPPVVREIRTLPQLNAFIEDHFDNIGRLVRSQCFQPPEQSDEVIQELYPRLVRFLANSPEGIREPWAFICITARRLAIDAFRRTMTRSHRFVPLYDDTFLPPRSDSNVADTDETDEQSRLLHDAIQSLNSRQQLVVRHIFLDGHRGRDVARELQLSESYVAELKTAALAKLRQHLQRHATGHPSA